MDMWWIIQKSHRFNHSEIYFVVLLENFWLFLGGISRIRRVVVLPNSHYFCEDIRNQNLRSVCGSHEVEFYIGRLKNTSFQLGVNLWTCCSMTSINGLKNTPFPIWVHNKYYENINYFVLEVIVNCELFSGRSGQPFGHLRAWGPRICLCPSDFDYLANIHQTLIFLIL